jgi:hypothetical protein
MNPRKLAVSASMFLCICLAGCGGGSKPAPTATTPEQESAKAQFDSQVKIAAQTAQTYRAMDNPTLLKNLMDQSAARKEPFNSLAYRELKTRTDVNPDTLASLVKTTKNGSALLPLLLLRRQNEKAYMALPAELRAGVLTDALANSKTFNTWGLPHPHAYREEAAMALVESGRSAYPALKRLLSDKRPAPVFGSQEYMEYQRYQYRVCDYALWFLQSMQEEGQSSALPVAPADRDALISKLAK